MYNRIICETLGINKNRARLVEAYLRLRFGVLDALSREDIRTEYGIIGEAIDADPIGAESLALSYGMVGRNK